VCSRFAHGLCQPAVLTCVIGLQVSGVALRSNPNDASSSMMGKANGAAAGDFTLTVFGMNFGKADMKGKARLGTSCLSTTWKADTSIYCRMPAGLGKDIPVVFTLAENSAAGRKSSVTKAFSYDVAKLTSWIFWEGGRPYPYNQPVATGGSSISVRGINFGAAGYTDTSRFGKTASDASNWISDSVLAVKVAGGVGEELTAIFTTPAGVGTASKAFSYGDPVITGRALGTTFTPLLDVFNGPVSGNTTTTLVGFNFGRVDYTGKGRLGGTAFKSVLTNWLSDSFIALRTPPGACASAEVSFTVGMQRDTHTKAWTYDAPTINAAPHAAINGSAINSPATGSKTVSVLGSNFGVFRASGKGKYGDTSGEASKWVSDSTTAFRSPAGVAAGLTAAYTVCGRFGSVEMQLSYDVPTVTDQTPSNGATDGGSTITLLGLNFGTADYSSRAAVGTHTNATLVYLDGAGGLQNYNVSGGTSCETTRWLSETSASCKVAAGAGVEYGVSFTVGVQVGTQATGHFYSYDKPVMTAAFPANGPAYGGENVTLSFGGELTTYSITMLGRDFGRADYSPKARLGDTDCMAAQWVSHSSIMCKIPGGACVDASITVTLQGRNNGTQFGVATKVFSYDAPSLSTIDVGNNTGPTSGGTEFRINGKNFGPNAPGYSVEYRIGSTQMNQTTWISDTHVQGIIPAGVCKALTVGILACDQEGTLSEVFSYFVPNVTGANGGEVNSRTWIGERSGAALDPVPSAPLLVQTGGSTVSVSGAYFGTADYTGHVRFGGTSGIATNWTSDTSVEATSPPGVCSDQALVYTICDQPGTKEHAFCYDTPFVTSGTSKWPNRPTTGGATISMLGVNFGTAHYSPGGRVLWTELKTEWTSASADGLKNYTGTACIASNWQSFSSVSCKIPSGVYPDHVVRFTVCGEAGSSNNVTTFTYDEPFISELKGGNSPATGMISLTIRGYNFGTADYSGKAYVGPPIEGYSAANASHTAFMLTDWTSDSSILTQTPAGLGLDLKILFSFNVTSQPTGTLDSLFSYDGPTISSSAYSNGPTSGALNITISGVNYGQEDYYTLNNLRNMLRAGGTASDSTYWLSDSSMTGLLSPGVCPYRPLSVSVFTQVGSATEVFSYDKPEIFWNETTNMFSAPLVDSGDSTFFSPNAPTASTQNATISGYNFGSNDYTVKTRIGKTSVLLMKWSSDTAVVGMVAPGVCHLLDMSVMICDQVGTASQVFTYNSPIVQMNGTNIPTTGKQLLTLQGLNFGSDDYSVMGGIGFTSGETTLWTADTQIQIKVAPGVRGELIAIATACERIGTQQDMYAYFTYNSPALSSVKGNGPSNGGTTATVAGSNFGTAWHTGALRMGETNATDYGFGATAAEVTAWDSDTAIKAKIAAGVSHLLGITFTIGALMGTSSGHFTYDVPRATKLQMANRPTSGGTSTTIIGNNFGAARYSHAAQFGSTAAQADTWISSTAVRAKVAAGCGSEKSLVVTVGDTVYDPVCRKAQEGSGTFDPTLCTQMPVVDHTAWERLPEVFTYDAASVTGIFGVQLTPTSGQNSITVTGKNMGKYATSHRARLHHSASEGTAWISDREVTLKAPAGCGKMKEISLTVCGLSGTATNLVTYEAPQISSAGPVNGATAGGFEFVTLAGANFLSFSMSGKGRVGSTVAASTAWDSDTSVSLSPSAGVCTASITFTICEQFGTLTHVFTYNNPSLQAFSGANGPKEGGSTATITGQNFATFDATGASRIGPTAAYTTVWSSNTAIAAIPLPGHDGMLRIGMTICSLKGSTTQSFTFDSPVITRGGPVNGPATAGTVTLYGKNFAVADYSGDARFGGTGCEVTKWTSNSLVSCKYPSGTGEAKSVSFSMALRVGTSTEVFTYDSPSITDVVGTNGPPSHSSGATVTVLGKNFGTSDYTVTAKVGVTACSFTKWVSDSHVTCVAPSGACPGQEVSIDVQGKKSTVHAVFSYDVPTVTSGDVPNGPGTGGNTISVAGKNFGTASYSAEIVVVGDYVIEAELSRWVSDTMLMVKIPMGGGVDYDIAAAVCGLYGTLTSVYSYDALSISAVNYRYVNPPFTKYQSNGPQTGGTLPSIFGQNFGAVDLSLKGRIGGTSTITSHWTSDSSLSMKTPPGVDLSADVNVYMPGREETHSSTLSDAFSFDSPSIRSVVPPVAVGGSTITISGRSMGIYDTSMTASVGGTACEAVMWKSAEEILCKTINGVGGQNDIELTTLAGTATFSLADGFTYSGPVVTAAVLPNGPQSGGTTVTIAGSSFGGWDVSPTAKTGDTACSTTIWISSSSLHALLPAGLGSAAITVEESSTGTTFTGSKAGIFHFDGPRPTSVLLANAPGTGGTTLTLMGSNFGSYADAKMPLTARIGETDCKTTVWSSDSSATCIAAVGVGASLPLAVNVGGSGNVLDAAVTYDGFYVDSMSTNNGPPAGGSSLIITGKMLGTEASPATVKFGAAAAKVTWTSATSISVEIPPYFKEYPGTDVTVTAGRSQVLPRVFSYDAAEIVSMKPTRGELRGGNKVTVSGTNFGGLSSTFYITVGDVNCTTVTWISDDKCICVVPSYPEYGLVSVSYIHRGVSHVRIQDLDNYPEFYFNLSDSYEYRVYNGPKVIGTPVQITLSSTEAATMELAGGTKLEIASEAFPEGTVAALSEMTPFEGAEPQGTDEFASPLVSIGFADANGNPVVPNKPLPLTIPVNLNIARRAGSQLPSIAAAGGPPAKNSLAESGPPSQRRLLQVAGSSIRAAWLDKCTGFWKPICGTKYNEATNVVAGDIPIEVFAESCFNPKSGCTTAIVEAQQCEGEGGTFTAMKFASDPCPTEVVGSDDRTVAIIVGTVLGVVTLCLCAAMLIWRMRTLEEEDDESYYSDKSYSDDDEEVGSQYMSQQSVGSFQGSPRMYPGSYMPGSSFPAAGPMATPGFGMQMQGYGAPQTPYGQFGMSAGPMEQGYTDMGAMSMGMGLPPPVFAQGMGSGAMAGGSPQGYYPGPARGFNGERQM